MPTRFLTDEQLAAYGRYAAGPPDQAVLERFFFLDDADRDLVAKRRGDHNRLGFALQLVTVRHVGAFLGDPLDVPLAVLGYVAAQLGMADPSCVKRYTERDKTRLEHQWEIAGVDGFASFASAEAGLVQWLDDQAWTTGDGPRALFYAAVAWLREGKVLLPGVTTLVELVATVRQAAEDRLYDTLATSVTAGQARSLEGCRKLDALAVLTGPLLPAPPLARTTFTNPAKRSILLRPSPARYRQAGSDAGSVQAAGLDGQFPSEFGDAFPHSGGADPRPPALGHSRAIVANLQP